MSDDFYNQNIGPLKGSYFGPGVVSSESQRMFSDYYAKSINPVRESIRETEERKMKAEKARQDIEAEKERREKAARKAELELAAQEKVEGVFGKVDLMLQIEDPAGREQFTLSGREPVRLSARSHVPHSLNFTANMSP